MSQYIWCISRRVLPWSYSQLYIGFSARFYRATRMRSADNAVARCPSVRPSHAGTLSKYGYIYPQFFFTMPYHSSFPHQTGWQYFDGDLPKNGGVKCKGDMKKSPFSTNISLNLANDARYSHYYGRRIGNRIHGTSLNDLQCPFQGQDYSTSNNLKMVPYNIHLYLQWPTNKKSYDLSNGAIFNDLERPLGLPAV